ncbi:MAG: FkbM family methyltransferase [Limisphaerales bacterium]
MPRALRNALRAPGRTFAWWLNDLRPPADFAIRPGWSLRAPRNALHAAYSAQLNDPAQATEFDDFIGLLRQQSRVVLFDVGCHFGIFSFAAAHFGGPTARAIALDPSALAGNMVKRVAALNGFQPQVRFVQAAVGAAVGVLEMVEAGVTAAGYVVLPQDHPASDRTRIPMTTLDHLVEQVGEWPTVIKIDVESYEAEVLRGGQRTLGRHSIPLSLEIHNQMARSRGVDPGAVLQLLEAFGYAKFVSGGHALTASEIATHDLVRVIAFKG